MPSRSVADDLNAGTYYLTLTIGITYLIVTTVGRLCASHCVTARITKGWSWTVIFSCWPQTYHRHVSRHGGISEGVYTITSWKFKGNFETTEPGVLKLFVDDDGIKRFWREANAPKMIENPDVKFYAKQV